MTAYTLKAGVDYVLKGRAEAPEIIALHHPKGLIDYILLPLDAFGRFNWRALPHDVVLHAKTLKVAPKRHWPFKASDPLGKIQAKARFAAPVRFGGCIYALQKARKGPPRQSVHDNRGLDLGSEAIGTLLSSPMILDALPALPDGPDYTQNLRVAVVLHLHYPELWEEFAAVLAHSKLAFKLVVTLSAPNPELKAAIVARFKDASVQVLDNLGRDIRPFMHVLHSGALDDVDLICKLHAKRSVLSGVQGSRFGHLWRRRNLLDLLGSPTQVAHILTQFEIRPKLGMLGSALLRLRNGNGPEPGFEASLKTREALCRKAGIDPKHIKDDLFAGTMFWVRRAALETLRHLSITDDQYTPERQQEGDQFEHALERFFADCTRAQGYLLGDIAPLTLTDGPLSHGNTPPIAPRALWAGPNIAAHWVEPLPEPCANQRIALVAVSGRIPAPVFQALRDAGYLTVLCTSHAGPEPDMPIDAMFTCAPGGAEVALWGAALRAAPQLWDADALLLLTDQVTDLPLEALEESQADCVSTSPDDPLALISLRAPALADPEVRAFFTTALNWTNAREAHFRYTAKLKPLLTETCGLSLTALASTAQS